MDKNSRRRDKCKFFVNNAKSVCFFAFFVPIYREHKNASKSKETRNTRSSVLKYDKNKKFLSIFAFFCPIYKEAKNHKNE